MKNIHGKFLRDGEKFRLDFQDRENGKLFQQVSQLISLLMAILKVYNNAINNNVLTGINLPVR
jgi:hypothetical protein